MAVARWDPSTLHYEMATSEELEDKIATINRIKTLSISTDESVKGVINCMNNFLRYDQRRYSFITGQISDALEGAFLCLPTGAGKTAVAFSFIEEKDANITFFIVPSPLTIQTKHAFENYTYKDGNPKPCMHIIRVEDVKNNRFRSIMLDTISHEAKAIFIISESVLDHAGTELVNSIMHLRVNIPFPPMALVYDEAETLSNNNGRCACVSTLRPFFLCSLFMSATCISGTDAVEQIRTLVCLLLPCKYAGLIKKMDENELKVLWGAVVCMDDKVENKSVGHTYLAYLPTPPNLVSILKSVEGRTGEIQSILHGEAATRHRIRYMKAITDAMFEKDPDSKIVMMEQRVLCVQQVAVAMKKFYPAKKVLILYGESEDREDIYADIATGDFDILVLSEGVGSVGLNINHPKVRVMIVGNNAQYLPTDLKQAAGRVLRNVRKPPTVILCLAYADHQRPQELATWKLDKIGAMMGTSVPGEISMTRIPAEGPLCPTNAATLKYIVQNSDDNAKVFCATPEDGSMYGLVFSQYLSNIVGEFHEVLIPEDVLKCEDVYAPIDFKDQTRSDAGKRSSQTHDAGSKKRKSTMEDGKVEKEAKDTAGADKEYDWSTMRKVINRKPITFVFDSGDGKESVKSRAKVDLSTEPDSSLSAALAQITPL